VTSTIDQTLTAQRAALRAQLATQRQVIAQQLDLSGDKDYPRSATMRFLKRRTVPVATALGGVATLFGGMRLYRTISAVLASVGTLRATTRK
jgi:hypothetical protein